MMYTFFSSFSLFFFWSEIFVITLNWICAIFWMCNGSSEVCVPELNFIDGMMSETSVFSYLVVSRRKATNAAFAVSQNLCLHDGINSICLEASYFNQFSIEIGDFLFVFFPTNFWNEYFNLCSNCIQFTFCIVCRGESQFQKDIFFIVHQ